MKRAWNAYLVFDWKVGEALGGVLRRFLTVWLLLLVAGLAKGVITDGAWSVVGLVPCLALGVWMYQPRRIFRLTKYSGWSVPSPAAS